MYKARPNDIHDRPSVSRTLHVHYIFVFTETCGARTRVTFSANNRFFPIWTRDGTRLTFADGTEVAGEP
jgi:Tol biopolymer transport system component